MPENRLENAISRAMSSVETDTNITGVTASSPKRNMWVYLFQFSVVHIFIGTVMICSLYNLTYGADNRDIWISLLSWTIGVLVPSPSNLKANKYIYPIQAVSSPSPSPSQQQLRHDQPTILKNDVCICAYCIDTQRKSFEQLSNRSENATPKIF